MRKKPFFSILFIVIGLTIAGLISYSAFKENKRNKQIEKEIDTLRKEAEKIRQNNQEMEEKISYFETPEFQERIAKEKLNLQKENENVVVIKPSPVLKETQTPEEDLETQEIKGIEKPNYIKWWDYFFKY